MTIKIRFNQNHLDVKPGLYTGAQLRQLVDLGRNKHVFVDIDGDIDIPVKEDDLIVLRGGEHFVSSGELDLPDNPCLRHPHHVHINDCETPTPVSKAKLYGKEVRQLAQDIPESEAIYLNIDGAKDEPIKDDDRLIMAPGLCFISVPCGNVGEKDIAAGILNRQFHAVQEILPQAELIHDGNRHLLVIPDFPLPNHFTSNTACFLVQIPAGYPATPLDMFYLHPAVNLSKGGTPEGAGVTETFLGKPYQRFSWHYKSRPWNPSKDSLLSHLRFCQTRLENNN